MSVVSSGTHDMETLRQWWQDDEKVRSKFAKQMLVITLPEPELTGKIARRIIQQLLDSPAMWAVFPLQDFLAMDETLRSEDIEGERINIPAITILLEVENGNERGEAGWRNRVSKRNPRNDFGCRKVRNEKWTARLHTRWWLIAYETCASGGARSS